LRGALSRLAAPYRASSGIVGSAASACPG
jgi:hypothetical protein